MRLLDHDEPSICHGCLQQKRYIALLVLIVVIDLAACGSLFSSGRKEVLILGFLRALLLSFCFGLAVKLGLGALETPWKRLGNALETALAPGLWHCGAPAPTELHGDSELERQRAAVANREAHSWKRNLVLGICFLGVTVESTYTGIQVLAAGARDGARGHLLHAGGGVYEFGASGHEIARQFLEIP